MLPRFETDLTSLQKRLLAIAISQDGVRRPALAEQLQISPQTVMRLVRGLETLGVVEEKSVHEGGIGKPAREVTYASGRLGVLGFAITEQELSIIAEDLARRELARVVRTGRFPTPEKSMDNLKEMFGELRENLPPNVAFCEAGVAAQGLFVKAGEIVSARGNPGAWSRFALSAELGNLTGLPVILQNDASALMAQYQERYGLGSGNRFLIHLSTGIGGGAVSNGTLLTGRQGNAGEVGSLVPDSPYRPTVTNMMAAAGVETWGNWNGINSLPTETRKSFAAWCTRSANALAPALHAIVALLDVEEIVIASQAPRDVITEIVNRVTITQPGQSLLARGLPHAAILPPSLTVLSKIDMASAAASLARNRVFAE